MAKLPAAPVPDLERVVLGDVVSHKKTFCLSEVLTGHRPGVILGSKRCAQGGSYAGVLHEMQEEC
jgi:hypothetical protein